MGLSSPVNGGAAADRASPSGRPAGELGPVDSELLLIRGGEAGEKRSEEADEIGGGHEGGRETRPRETDELK